MSKTYPTRISLTEEVRRELLTLLNANLANAVDLVLQCKQAHWNVRGPDFFQHHAFFDEVYEHAVRWMDEIAERATTLGGVAEGTLEPVAKRTRLPAYSLDLTRGRDHVDALRNALAGFANGVRSAVDAASNLGDEITASKLASVGEEADMKLWMVEAHLQGER